MIIKSMIQRENFYDILVKTLEDYYFKVHKKDVVITVTNEKTNYLVFENFGSIHSNQASYRVYKYWANEYKINNNVPKFMAAQLYIAACFIFKNMLCQRYLKIENHSLDKDVFIYPANRKIRIFDLQNKYVDAVVKHGFTLKYFNQELNFRLNTKYDFVPKIIDSGDNWYREKLLDGLPLARVRNKHKFKDSIKIVNQYLLTIKTDTLISSKYLLYLATLKERLLHKIDLAVEKKNITNSVQIIEFVELLFRKQNSNSDNINLVMSHGDLQAGNIWWSHDKVYVIDWETYGYRSEWYDLYILNYSLRRAKSWKKLLALSCKRHKFTAITYAKPSILSLTIVAFEDLEFYLDDLLELPNDFGKDIFDRVAKEIIDTRDQFELLMESEDSITNQQ